MYFYSGAISHSSAYILAELGLQKCLPFAASLVSGKFRQQEEILGRRKEEAEGRQQLAHIGMCNRLRGSSGHSGAGPRHIMVSVLFSLYRSISQLKINKYNTVKVVS